MFLLCIMYHGIFVYGNREVHKVYLISLKQYIAYYEATEAETQAS